MNHYQERRDNAIAELLKEGFSQMLVTDPFVIYYLTNELVAPMERTWVLYLSTNKSPVLFANRLFHLKNNSGIQTVLFSDTDDSVSMIADVIDTTLPLGIDQTMCAKLLLALQEKQVAPAYQNTSYIIDAVIGRKTLKEQQLMREASRINDLAMEQFKQLIHEGVTELEVANQIETIYRSLGASGNSFEPIVCFGANAADPHHMPDATVLKEGDVILFDVGCIKDGYCSDMTRCFFYKTVSEKQRAVYEIVKNANLNGEAHMGPTFTFADADKAARDLITKEGYGPYFTHRLGHSIGMSVHERGDVSSINHNYFEPGRCISCEPGIYLENEFGIRIEDLCIITENGVEIINHYSKELEIIY